MTTVDVKFPGTLVSKWDSIWKMMTLLRSTQASGMNFDNDIPLISNYIESAVVEIALIQYWQV